MMKAMLNPNRSLCILYNDNAVTFPLRSLLDRQSRPSRQVCRG